MTFSTLQDRAFSLGLYLWKTDHWIEKGLTSHQIHYRSYRGRVFTGQM